MSSKATPAVASRGDPRDSLGRGRGGAAPEEAVSPQVAKGSGQQGAQEDLPAVARHRVRVDHRDREDAGGKAQGLPGDRPPPTPGEIAIDHSKGQDRTKPVTANGVSAAKVVATIDVPASHHGMISTGQKELPDAGPGAPVVIEADDERASEGGDQDGPVKDGQRHQRLSAAPYWSVVSTLMTQS